MSAIPGSVILHPVRLAGNAWDIARRSSWFDSIPPREVPWESLKIIHLIEITQPNHNPPLMEHLAGCDLEVVCYAHVSPRLPCKAILCQIKSMSVTAHLLTDILGKNTTITEQDAALFSMAITERTGAGLSSKVTNTDWNALQELRTHHVPPRHISNQVILGLREGQKGLLGDLLKQTQDYFIGNWPISLAITKSSGNVQELMPVMESLWSQTDPHVLIAGACGGNKTQIWFRSRIPQINPFAVFQEYRPRSEGRWTVFPIPDGETSGVKTLILNRLNSVLKPDIQVREIMSQNPRCVDWNETVANALDIMLRFNLMTLIVTKSNLFAGIVTRRDLDKAVQMDLWTSAIGPFVSSDSPSVTPDTPVRILRSLMVRSNAMKISVVENGIPVGIITPRELLRAVQDHLPLPPQYLPLIEASQLPKKGQIENLMKRVIPLRVLHILKKIGAKAAQMGMQAYAVGGFVRDLLLEKPNLDIDIVLTEDALPFALAICDELKAESRVFDRFHTARIIFEGIKIDFSTARIEHYAQPGALPKVELGGLSNDLYRRDFTVNAIALDLSPGGFLEILDFFSGYRDLAAKKIRILNSFSFLEDPTRLFRAVRFAGRFHFELADDTKRAFDIAVQREIIGTLSMKRIGAEISRCLQEEHPHRIIEMLYQAGLLKSLHPRLADPSLLPTRFRLIPGIIRRFSVLGEPIDSETVSWIGLLTPLSPLEAGKLLMSMGTYATRRKIIVESLESLATVPQKLSKISANDDLKLFELLGRSALEGLVALIAFALDKSGARRVFDYLIRLRNIRCEITGKDLLAVGIPAGPHMRMIFREITNAKIRGEIRNRKEEIDYAERLFKSIRIPG